MGAYPKPLGRMKQMLELQNMMLKQQNARDGMGLYPLRLLKEEIEQRRTPKERERGWINDYKRGAQPKKSIGYLDEQLIMSRKILGREPDNPQPFISSLYNFRAINYVKIQGRERGWTTTTSKEPILSKSLYGTSKPVLHLQHNQPRNKALQNIKLENARKLETRWASFVMEQCKGQAGSGGMLGRPKDLTAFELHSLQKANKSTEKQERDLGSTEAAIEKSTLSHEQQTSQRKKYHTRLVVPIGTLERSGFGTARCRARITPEGQRDAYNQLDETGWVNRYDTAESQRQCNSSEPFKERSDANILKEGIEKEEEEAWMSSYRRKQMREICRLAKKKDMTASEVLKESYDRYREEGWINPLQRQKPGVYGLAGRAKSPAEMLGSI